MDVRLQKILSAAGVASRRAAEKMMLDGRVSVNGATVLDLGTKADPDRDDIRVDGRRIKGRERPRYLLLNKPRGYVTTRADPEGRPTVLALLEGVREYVYPVGRLDYDSEGLLLLTNDGELAARLTHPRHEVERVYEARVRGVPDARALDRLARGMVIDGRRTAPGRARLLDVLSPPRASGASRPAKRAAAARKAPAAGRAAPAVARAATTPAPAGPPRERAVIELAIHEGRNRQVRKMCEAIGHPVLALRRTRIGPIADPKLPPGAYRDLSPRELSALKRAAGLI